MTKLKISYSYLIGDLLHYGHLELLKKAKEFNKIIKKLYLLEENDKYARKKEFRAWLNTN